VLDHPTDHCLGYEERGPEVEVNEVVEVFDGHVEERHWTIRASVVHQDIEWLKPSYAFGRGIEIGDVQRDRFGTSAITSDGRGGLIDFGCGSRCEHDMSAGLR